MCIDFETQCAVCGEKKEFVEQGPMHYWVGPYFSLSWSVCLPEEIWTQKRYIKIGFCKICFGGTTSIQLFFKKLAKNVSGTVSPSVLKGEIYIKERNEKFYAEYF
jgi:hypothetical protein